MPYKDPTKKREQSRRWAAEHPEQRRQYALAHQEELRAASKKRRMEKAEEIRLKKIAYREANPVLLREQKAASYQRNKEKIAAKQKERLANRSNEEIEASKVYHANYLQENYEKIIAQHAIYKAEHAEEIAAYWPAYYAKNKEKSLERAQAWRKSHPEERRMADKRRRASKRASQNDLTHAQWEEIQIAQDHRCYYCKKRCKGKLTQDHITPLDKGGGHTLHNVIAACSKCNSRKGTKPPPVPVQPLLLTIAPSKPYKKKAS
jgi:5-methylcytosine-specific restriction endonuclease McrA